MLWFCNLMCKAPNAGRNARATHGALTCCAFPRNNFLMVLPAARPRLPVAALFAITVAAGLASRGFPDRIPPFLARYAGDALWAAMVYWIIVFIRPRLPPLAAAMGTFGFALAIELSQLYRAPWLDAIRATRAGALALGQGFLWSDVACYAAGAALGLAVDAALFRPRVDRQRASAE